MADGRRDTKKGGGNTGKDKKSKDQGRTERGNRTCGRSSCKKQRDQSYEGRKTAVAGDEAVGKNGDEPFSGRVDDPAARYSGCIAAKAHSHGKGLFSAGFAALEGTVQIICDPGQITKIFQKGKEREENGHGRKHDRDNPGQYPVYTQNQNPVEPLGRIDCHKSSGKFFLKGEKEGGKQGGRVVGSCDRQPEN